MDSDFAVELLDPGKHRREDFSCESPELTDFLRKRARKEMAAKTCACFVLCPGSKPSRIAGYYTLSATAIHPRDIPPDLAKRLPRYPELPATLTGRLARDLSFRRLGIGDRLVLSAFLAWPYDGSSDIGSVAVITDPKDAKAEAFYREFGFLLLKGRRLFLPMSAIP